jgi:hypothetical protein
VFKATYVSGEENELCEPLQLSEGGEDGGRKGLKSPQSICLLILSVSRFENDSL